MNIVITGGAGFLGQRLARRLLQLGQIAGGRIDRIVLVDQAPAPDLGDARVRTVVADVADPEAMGAVIGPEMDLVFHLAAVVSGAAEADFGLGLRINLDASRLLLDLCRAAGRRPRGRPASRAPSRPGR